MMMKLISFFAIVLAILANNVSADGSSGKSQTCPGGYSQGTQMDIGRYWYECRDGKVIPKGCLAEDGRRVDIDATFDTATNRMQCIIDKDGFLSVIYKACIFQGASHDVGQQWDDGVAFYTCVQEGANVRAITLGCVDQGKLMKLDERVVKNEFIFQCKKATDGTPKMNKVGCVQDGTKYNIGETYENSKFWYTCTDSGSKIVGCMYESHRLQDNDRITKDDMMYTCKVNGENTDFIPFGCIQREENGAAIDRKVGCSWVEGIGSHAYEYTCKETSPKKLSKVQVQCVYRSSKGVFKLQPGCATVAEGATVGCVDSGSSILKIETYSADAINQLPGGLRQC